MAEVRDPVTDTGVIEVLWSSAVDKGRVAGRNMATEPVAPYATAPPLNVTRLAGSKITIMGTRRQRQGLRPGGHRPGRQRDLAASWATRRSLSRSSTMPACAWRSASGYDRRRRGDGRPGAVVPAAAVSSPRRADVSPIMPDLQEPGAPLPELIGSFWQSWEASLA